MLPPPPPPAVEPAPTGVPAEAAGAQIIETPEEEAPMPLTEEDLIRDQLDRLRASIAAKKAEKEAQVQAVREMQQKQAAYGRDVEQSKPTSAGYATESEKIMGGQTGYAKPVSGLGALSDDVQTITKEVLIQTAKVKQLTQDVKAGVVPRSELVLALKELQIKSDRAQQLASQLSDWNSGPFSKIALISGILLASFLAYKAFK
ncbi:hypothetical protein C4588_06500 [Candidatus Parcubacteria bacterium]|nr:MAG: hypothetical protein C4588_06500 [Candidatus Parcubacteria bacterium]